ncbi:MAG: histidinol dehydrogenase [Actinobacteria bacterium]|nr:histidinol dehydrogenase [Actinomycetota bacterium]
MVRRARLRAGGTGSIVHSLRPRADQAAVRADVEATLAAVRSRGDDALVEQAVRFGSTTFSHDNLRVKPISLENGLGRVSAALRSAITFAADQVRELAEATRPSDRDLTLQHGQRITIRAVPVDSVGCYVPGGRAAYPSSMIMAVVPAQVAGVRRIAVVTPPGLDGKVSDQIKATASILGIGEVYAAGGAAAIGALAYGTATVAPVAIIAGPGNAWVQEAKRQVHGAVGIDSIAGPSEVLILADASADPDVVAADLQAQAEHGPDSVSVLATTDPSLSAEVEQRLLDGVDVVGRITIVDCLSLPLMVELAEAFAPEHLQINLRPEDAERVAPLITRAGCIFLGANGGTAFGDYVAGSNHILPTGGAARFASAVGPATFMRRMSVVDLPDAAVEVLTPHLATLADAEGFPLHRRSAELRPGARSAT